MSPATNQHLNYKVLDLILRTIKKRGKKEKYWQMIIFTNVPHISLFISTMYPNPRT